EDCARGAWERLSGVGVAVAEVCELFVGAYKDTPSVPAMYSKVRCFGVWCSSFTSLCPIGGTDMPWHISPLTLTLTSILILILISQIATFPLIVCTPHSPEEP
ncbi:unnamed protein product, partial [Choristocarpus tenellus]